MALEKCLETAGSGTGACTPGRKIAEVSMRVCSRLEWVVAVHQSLVRGVVLAKVLVSCSCVVVGSEAQGWADFADGRQMIQTLTST